MLYHSIHYLDLIRSWLGNPIGVYAKTVRNPQCAGLAATKSSIVLDYGDWKRAFEVTNHGHDFADESQCSFVQWDGTQGAIRIDMGLESRLSERQAGYAFVCGAWQRSPPVAESSRRRELVSGRVCWKHGGLQAYVEGSVAELPIGFESAYETMALVEAVYRSSAQAREPLPL